MLCYWWTSWMYAAEWKESLINFGIFVHGCCYLHLVPKGHGVICLFILFTSLFTSLLLQVVDCALIAPWASVFFLFLLLLTVFCWPWHETMRPLVLLHCWGWIAFLSVTDIWTYHCKNYLVKITSSDGDSSFRFILVVSTVRRIDNISPSIIPSQFRQAS